MTAPVRLAVWSGPRTISSALMRSWDGRPDTVVVDEPFCAAYFVATGAQLPGRAETLARQESRWDHVVASLSAPLPPGTSVQYQKHMAHHLLPAVIDSADLLTDPPAYLERRCDFAGLRFDQRMLSWRPGPRPTDGPWAPFWYQTLWKSTGFAPPAPVPVPVDEAAEALVAAAMPSYRRLHTRAYRRETGNTIRR